MRIALRTSGGRGEYEMAGTHGSVVSANLFDKQIIIEIVPGLRIYTNNFVKNAQGKRRIRLVDPKRDSHIYVLLAAVLLLPRPIRQLSETGMGNFQLINDKYSIGDVQFDIVTMNTNEVVIRPTFIKLANSATSRIMDVAQRMKLIFNLWEKVGTDYSANMATTLVNAHHATFNRGNPYELLEVIKLIRNIIEADEDPLRQLLRNYGLSDASTYDMAIFSGADQEFTDENPASIIQSTQDTVRKWRLIAYRGAEGERFKKEVNQVYNYTCLFTGYYLPTTPLTGTPGVDAAHILPWATHGINTVQNGICLSKLCHWAFDVGLLKVDFDYATKDYIISVPSIIKQQSSLIGLEPFLELEGAIPGERLPRDTAKWPNPDFIAKYNSSFSSDRES